MNMYIVTVFNLECKGYLVCMFGGEIPCVPSTVRKDTCLTVYIVLLGYYQIFESSVHLQLARNKKEVEKCLL